MSKHWTKFRACRGLSFALAVFAAVVPVQACAEAGAEPLSIEAVVKAFRSKSNTSAMRRARLEVASHRAEAAAALLRDAPTLGVEVETVPPGGNRRSGDEAPPPRTMPGTAKVILAQELTLGGDAARAAVRENALAEVDILEKEGELTDDEHELVVAYLGLRQEALIHADLERARPLVARLTKQARQAVRLGTLGALAANQAELLSDQIRTDSEQSQLAYGSFAERITAATGLPLATTPAAAPQALSMEFTEVAAGSIEKLPRVVANAQKQAALAGEQEELLSRRTLELGLGLARGWSDKDETSLVAELKLPLGVGAAAKSEARALVAERASAAAEGDLLKGRLAREVAKNAAEIKRLAGASRRVEGRVERLAKLYEKTEAAFRRGQGDLPEVFATLKELVEARLEAIRTQTELETAQVARRYLLRPTAN